MKIYKARQCLDCEEEYIPTSSRQKWCKSCGVEHRRRRRCTYAATYYKKNSELIQAKEKKYREENKEKLKQKADIRHKDNPLERKRRRLRRCGCDVTLEILKQTWEKQKGLSPIDGVPLDINKCHSDHCHKTKKVQGFYFS